MLKIRAIKIEVNTSSGLFGAEYSFTSGLNIVRGDNSTGKSTLFQSIMYGLGFEELLGGKNEKTMQSTLNGQVQFPEGSLHDVIQSFVLLEIENQDVVTIKRSIVSSYRKPQLIDVYFGGIITGSSKEISSRQMYLHDAGAASDADYGFHVFLAQFLGWEIPEIMTSKGQYHKLYLQQIAPAFIIEQKSGWSDFFATMPYFGMRNTEQRVIEFLLNLDVFENEKNKQEISYIKQDLINNWQKLYDKLNGLAERSGGKLMGITNHPVIINDFSGVHISVRNKEEQISLSELNDVLKSELVSIELGRIITVGDKIVSNNEELVKANNELNQQSLSYDLLSPEVGFDRAKMRQFESQLLSVQEDLKKNKAALKLNKLGGDLPADIALNICPTCEQEVSDSLLPIDIDQVPMRIEDNIAYLEAQEKMISVYMSGQAKTIRDKENRLVNLQNSVLELRQKIRSIRQELTQDERLPSVVEIEKRIDLKRKVEFFNRVLDAFALLVDEIKILSDEYEQVLKRDSSLPKDFLSSDDRRKLSSLQDKFIHLLSVFNYQSKPIDVIKISRETYLPVAQKIKGENMFYNIKFDSSASDFIRCIWAYSVALLQAAKLFNTNHPRLLMFDEPKQQDISINNFRSFLTELSRFNSDQVILFASFENSDIAFADATHGLSFNLIRINQKLVKPIVEDDF